MPSPLDEIVQTFQRNRVQFDPLGRYQNPLQVAPVYSDPVGDLQRSFVTNVTQGGRFNAEQAQRDKVLAERQAMLARPAMQFGQQQGRELARVHNAPVGSVGQPGGALPAINQNEALQRQYGAEQKQGLWDLASIAAIPLGPAGNLVDVAAANNALIANPNSVTGGIAAATAALPFVPHALASGIGSLVGQTARGARRAAPPAAGARTAETTLSGLYPVAPVTDANPLASVGEIPAWMRNSPQPAVRPQVLGTPLSDAQHVRSARVVLEAPPQKFDNLLDRGRYIQQQSETALGRRMDMAPKLWTAADKEDVATVMAADLKKALEDPNNAGQWYREHVDSAHRMAALEHPEILTDRRAQRGFNFSLAVTSQGQDVPANGRDAMLVFEHWKQNGRFPETLPSGGGASKGIMENSFKTYNRLVDDIGEDSLDQFMQTKYKVSDLKKLGIKIPGEVVDAEVYGSTLFGPKIGGGFFSNLEGRFEQLTMDKWWARSWGRYTGTLMAPKKAVNEQVAKFRAAAAADPVWRKRHNVTQKELRTVEGTLEAAGRTYRGFATGKYPDGTAAKKGYGDKDIDLHKASRSMFMTVLQPNERMTGQGRGLMREVAEQARQMLKSEGHDLSIADVQALLWFLEKDVYAKLGQNVTRVSFDDAVASIMKLRGHTDEAIQNARTGRSVRGSATVGGGVSLGGNTSRGTGTPVGATVQDELLKRVSSSVGSIAAGGG